LQSLSVHDDEPCQPKASIRAILPIRASDVVVVVVASAAAAATIAIVVAATFANPCGSSCNHHHSLGMGPKISQQISSTVAIAIEFVVAIVFVAHHQQGYLSPACLLQHGSPKSIPEVRRGIDAYYTRKLLKLLQAVSGRLLLLP